MQASVVLVLCEYTSPKCESSITGAAKDKPQGFQCSLAVAGRSFLSFFLSAFLSVCLSAFLSSILSVIHLILRFHKKTRGNLCLGLFSQVSSWQMKDEEICAT